MDILQKYTRAYSRIVPMISRERLLNISSGSCTISKSYASILMQSLELTLRILEIPGLILSQGAVHPDSSIRYIIHNNYEIRHSTNINKASN
jgi:hypothetical protein